MARNARAKGTSGGRGVGSGASKTCGRGSSRGSTIAKEGLPPTQPRRSGRSKANRPSASTGLATADDGGDGQSQESAGEVLLDLGRTLSGTAAIVEGRGVARSAGPAPRVSKRGARRIKVNYAVLNGSPNRAAIATAAASDAAEAAAEAAAAGPGPGPAPRKTPPRADPAAGGPRQDRGRRHTSLADTIARQAADILRQPDEEEDDDVGEEEEDEDDDDAVEDDDDDDDDEDDPIPQDQTTWTYCQEEKEANFLVLIKLKDVIHSKEFAYKNGRGNDHWYTRVAHLIVKKLAKNKRYMRACGHDYEARYSRNQMQRLRKWVSSQRTQHHRHLRKRGTGGSGGKLPRSQGGLARYRQELFSTNAASSKKKYMKEAFVSSSGKSLNLTEEGLGGAPGSAGPGAGGSGGGAEKEQGGIEVEPSKSKGKAEGKGQGQGQGDGKGKGKDKGKGEARQDGDTVDLDLDADGSRWSQTSSESESRLLSPKGGMSDGSGEGGSGGEKVEEVSPPSEKKRKRKSSRCSPQSTTESLQRISDAKADRQEETLMKVAGMFGGGTGAGGSSWGGGGSSSSAPNAEQRRIDLQERPHRVTTLQQAWKDAEVANQKGYGSLEEEKEAYLAYKQAVQDV